jgi:TRAP-type transport system periplasmic protein
MKRLFWVLLLVLIIAALLLGGCSSTPTPTVAPSTSAPATSAPTTTTTAAPTTKPAISAPASTTVPPTTSATPTTVLIPKVSLKAAVIGPPPGFPPSNLLKDALEIMKKNSGGQIEITFYASGALLDEKTAFDKMSAGISDIGMIQPGWDPDRTGPLAFAGDGAMNFDYNKFVQHARDPGGFYDYCQTILHKYKIHMLSWPIDPGGQILSRTPIKSLANMKGKILRTTQGCMDFFKLLGASPLYMPPVDIYNALERGTIDGVVMGVDAMAGYKHQDLAKNLTIIPLTGFYAATAESVINLDAWNKLPAETKKIIDEAFIQAEKNHYGKAQATYDATMKTMTDAGVQVYALPDDEKALWIKTAAPYYDLVKAKYSDANKFGDEWARFEPIWNTVRP